jgi:hypothetical protein
VHLGYAVFAFEEIDDALSRPPLAATRALQAVGVAPGTEGWASTPRPVRLQLATLGSQYTLDPTAIQAATSQIPPRDVSLVGSRSEVDPTAIPSRLASALASVVPLTNAQWQSLHPFERFTLETLAGNTRLLFRALDEMARLPGHRLFGVTTGQVWIGRLARCEVVASTAAFAALAAKRVLDGRALDLARATGRRTARRAPELLDAIADRTVGPVEIECLPNVMQGTLHWQAHVSAVTGDFLPDASLLATTAAATALCGMLRSLDPKVHIGKASLGEEPWRGDSAGDESTQIYSPR